MAEDLLELGGKIKAEGNRRLSDVSDSSREGSVGSPSVVNERAHQKRMKKLEVKAAEERQKEKEEEERRVKRAVEENKRKQELERLGFFSKLCFFWNFGFCLNFLALRLDEENRKRRIRIEKLNEADARRRRIAKEKEEDDERRRKLAKEQEVEKRKKVEEEERKKEEEKRKRVEEEEHRLAREVEQRRKEIEEERNKKVKEEEERKRKKLEEEERKRNKKEEEVEDSKKKEKDKPIEESAVMKPTIKISDLSDDDSMMTMTGEPRRLKAKLNLSDDEGREEKRARNKTANIPIMPQQVRGKGLHVNHKNDISEQKEIRKIFSEQESPERKSSSVVLSKYNLESQCIVSISLFDLPEYYPPFQPPYPSRLGSNRWKAIKHSN